MQTLGARVFSVDKSPLAEWIARLPGVEFCQGSGFGLDPRQVGAADWLFCDMACYPERLLAWLERWLDLGSCLRFVCTVKFQGPADQALVRRFAALPGAWLGHLFHNKHELTLTLGVQRPIDRGAAQFTTRQDDHRRPFCPASDS